jgi:hypothetical protein
VALALLVVPLLLSFSAPLWRISMWAPQYPAGLSMDIHAHRVEGGNGGQDLREINILNHYIGMHPLEEETFVDVRWIPWALLGLAAVALAVAARGSRAGLVGLGALTAAVSVTAFGRFVYMLWVYGHVLDPRAPVEVQPFMPAVLGTKQIANFTVHSLPAPGSLFLGTFVLGLAVLLVREALAARAARPRLSTAPTPSAPTPSAPLPPGPGPRAVAAALTLLVPAALLAPAPARACVSCSSGDPTLRVLGEEAPTAWATRAGALLRVWGRQTQLHGGDHPHTEHLREARLDASVTVAPADWLVLGLTVPLQARETQAAHDPATRAFVPGDVDLGVRAVLWRDARSGPAHLLSAVAGVELPTTPVLRDADGRPRGFHGQVGSGSVDPRFGLAHVWREGAWSLQSSLVLQVPTRGHEGLRLGPVTRATATAQWQATRWLGLRLGAEGRLEGEARLAGAPLEGMSGAIGYVVPGVLWAASRSVSLLATAHLPLAATGHAVGELPTAGVGVLLDF